MNLLDMLLLQQALFFKDWGVQLTDAQQKVLDVATEEEIKEAQRAIAQAKLDVEKLKDKNYDKID